ncbi:unnamed protein product [Scytosiphon promiscuus]
MGAQYSTGTVSPDWKGWLEEGCSLENVRAIYNDFRLLVSSRRDDDAFFVNHRDFLQVFADVANFPPPGQGMRRGAINSLADRTPPRAIDAERSRRIHLDKCFSCFDVLERGRVPSGEVWGGLALLTGAPELSKVKFIFGMYDADRDGMLNETELRMAMTACATGFCRLHGIGPPPEGTLRSLAQEAFLHQAVVAEKLGARRAAEERQDVDEDRSVLPVTGTNPSVESTTTPAAIVVAVSIPATAVSSFCCANSRCRNFLKGVGSAGSADLLLLYRHEHELLRELAQVDGALDDYDRRAENDASAARDYATQRGGDTLKLVVGGARLHALAEKWGVGRLLQPATVHALLKQKVVAVDLRESGSTEYFDDLTPHAAASKSGKPNEAADVSAEDLHSPLRGGNGGARRISWNKSLTSSSPLASGRTSVEHRGGDNRSSLNHAAQSAVALGWSDGFESSPEVQMQVLMEVGNLVRKAARKRGAAQPAAVSTVAAAAAADDRALKAQTARRGARRAERERRIKERAREAAASLGRGEWKASGSAESAHFARAYKLGMSKMAKKGASTGKEQAGGGARLAALARGGAGRASLSGGEMRIMRDWDLLKNTREAAGNKAHPEETEGSTRWTAPFATQLDVDTLEDLVEGAGEFITDREAEEALAEGGDLEKDQLGRVTLVGFIRWCRLREKKRQEAEAMRLSPPPPWKERLKCWRKAWNEDVIEEFARLKRAMLGRDTRLRRAQGADVSSENDSASLTSSRDSSFGGPGYIGGGISSARNTKNNEEQGSGNGYRSSIGAPCSAEPRWSRFAVSLTIPRPKQHNGLTAAETADLSSGSSGHGERGKGDGVGRTASKRGERVPLSKSNHNGEGRGQTKAPSFSSHEQRKTQVPSSTASTVGAAAAAGAATWRSKLRLDVVRADAERSAVSPRTGAASARFDSPARDLLQQYEDAQKKLQTAFWQEQGAAKKARDIKAKADKTPKKEREAAEAEEGRKAAKMAPQVKEMQAVAWLDMPFLAATLPPPPFEDAAVRGRQKSSTTQTSARSTPAAANPADIARRNATSPASRAKSSHDDRGSLGSPPGSVETTGGGSGSGSGQTSLLEALAAEREAAAALEAAEMAAAERVAREFRGLFNSIPRDYRNELGFAHVLVTVVRIRYRGGPQVLGGGAGTTPRSPRPAGGNTKTTPAGAPPATASSAISPRGGIPNNRGARLVLRLAFFWDRDPFKIAFFVGAPNTVRAQVMARNADAVYHPLEELVSRLTVQVDTTASMKDVLDFMEPWKKFKDRLYGPQEEELPEGAVDPRGYARMVLEDIQTNSELLRQIPSMSFDRLRPVLAQHGLSEVGTLAELSARASRALEGRVKAAGAGGGLSRFGERAARMLFRMADKDQDGGLSFSEMLSMLRRMGMRGTQSAMATELDYIRALKEMGVKTDRNGFLTEDGLVAFYRDFGQLGDDIEASGVASLNSLLGVKLSAVGQVDVLAAKRLEDMSMEEHPLLGRAEKALLFLFRFAVDAHVDCSGESIADWLAPADGDKLLKEWLLHPGWSSRAVESLQQWLADGDEGVIPAFRSGAAALLGERWASARPGWYQPGGDDPSSVTANDDGESHDENGGGEIRGAPSNSRANTPSALVGVRGAGEGSGAGNGETTPPLNITPEPSSAIAASNGPAASARVAAAGSRGDDDRDSLLVAPASEPPRKGGNSGVGEVGGVGSAGGAERGPDDSVRSGPGRGDENDDGDRRPYTTERNNAKDLAQHLGVGGGDSGRDNDSGERQGGTGGKVRERDRAGGKGGLGGFRPERVNDAGVTNSEEKQGHEEGDSDLEDVFVEAGVVGEMEEALDRSKALRAMLASGLPSKIEKDIREQLEKFEEKARVIDERLQAATAASIARGVRAYDAARSRLEGVATLGLGTRKITARLQVTGFPVFSLLPAGMGEPMAGRLEEEAREARAEIRRRVALDEIDRAKDQLRQRREKEERELKRAEKLRLKGEEKMKEEIDLYERGLSARQGAAFRESEKALAEQYWRRLVAIRQRRRKGTPGAAAAVNNLGVLLVEQSERDSARSVEGRKLLKAAVAMAEEGIKMTGSLSESKANDAGQPQVAVAGVSTEEEAATAASGTEESGQSGKDVRTSERHISGGVQVDEWRVLLALFSSNLSFAVEEERRRGAQRRRYQRERGWRKGRQDDGQASRLTAADSSNLSLARVHRSAVALASDEPCAALFKSLPPAALSAASGPSDSWECLGVGVTLFEREDPFWWEREHPEDDEERKEALAAHSLKKSRSRRRLHGLEGDGPHDGGRREALVRNREDTGATEHVGGYTDLEVLEVIDPGRAARIRLRQARHKAQQERRSDLCARRKKFQRQLRLQEKEAEVARAASAQAREAYHHQQLASRRLKKAADARESRRQDLTGSPEEGETGARTGRFVRAAGAVKALRARTLGEDASARGVGGAIGRAAMRLANTLTNKINDWDANLDGGQDSDRTAGGGAKEISLAEAGVQKAEARAAARAAVRQGAAARAKTGGGAGGGKKKPAKTPPVS